MASSTFNGALRTWVDSLPAINSDTLDADSNAIPFDRSLIFPYAFRHAFAQRHADAGRSPAVSRRRTEHSRRPAGWLGPGCAVGRLGLYVGACRSERRTP